MRPTTTGCASLCKALLRCSAKVFRVTCNWCEKPRCTSPSSRGRPFGTILFLFFPVERHFFRKKPENALKMPLVLFVGALFLGRATSGEKILAFIFCLRTYDAENILGRTDLSSAKRIRPGMPAKPTKTISACVWVPDYPLCQNI